MKARKHTLRKAITTAVLAGTTFSTLAGTVTSVSALETAPHKDDLAKLNALYAKSLVYSIHDKNHPRMTAEQLNKELAEILSGIKPETLAALKEGTNEKSIYYNNPRFNLLKSYEDKFKLAIPQDSRSKLTSLTKVVTEEADKRLAEALRKEKEANQALEAEKQALEAEKAALQEKITAELNKIIAQQEELMKLKEALKLAESQPNEKEDVPQIDSALLEQLKAAEAKANQLKAQLESSKLEANQIIDKLMREINTAKADQSNLESLKALNEKLQATVQDLQTKNNALLEALNQAELERQVLQKQLQDAENKGKEQSKPEVNNNQAEKDAKIADLTAQLEKQKSDLTNLQNQLSTVEKELEASKAKQSELERTIGELEAKRAEKEVPQAPQANNNMTNVPSAQEAPKAPQAPKVAQSDVAKKEQIRTEAPKQEAKNNLPSTGDEMTNPFFTAAAMAIIAGVTGLTFAHKRKED